MAAKFFGQFLLEKGVINKDQLLTALDEQRKSNPLLGEISVELGLLDAAQADWVNEKQKREDKRFGDIAVEAGLLTEEQVGQVLDVQKQRRKFFGEILVEKGMLTSEQLYNELQLHAAEREDAAKTLEAGVAEHPLGNLMNTAIATCSKMFMRILKSQCQYSEVLQSREEIAELEYSARVDISGDATFTLALATNQETLYGVAEGFLNMPGITMDDELGKDAFGELLNIVMGYVVKDKISEDQSYSATPPTWDRAAADVYGDGVTPIAVHMTSTLGDFYIILHS